MARSFAKLFGLFVQVLVEHRKANKEGDTDEIFDALDVLVKIYQGVNLLDFNDAVEYLADHTLLLFRLGSSTRKRLAFARNTAGLLICPFDQTLNKSNQEHDRRHQLHNNNQSAERQESTNQYAA